MPLQVAKNRRFSLLPYNSANETLTAVNFQHSGGSRGCPGVWTPAFLIRVPFLKKNICSKHVVNAVTVSINIFGNA